MNLQGIVIQFLILSIYLSVPFSDVGKTNNNEEKQKILNHQIDQGVAIVVYGDSRSGHEVHKKIISCILEIKPQAVFHTGDLVFNGKSDENWSVFNSIVGDLLKVAPIYPALGNHERGTIEINQQLSLPNNGRWYSVDLQNIHFIVLDVCDKYSMGSPQYDWLENDLKNQPKNTKYTIAITHYPLYCTGPHRTAEKKLRRYLVPLFKKYGVDVVFSGHNHCYERSFSDGIYYIVTAGGGAPLYDQTSPKPYSQLYIKDYNFCTLKEINDTLFISALDTNMKQMDRFYVSN